MEITIEGCASCCQPGDHLCYQDWTAQWDCETRTWAGPTPGAKQCLPSPQPAGWAKVPSEGCTYRIRVQMSEIVCTGDTDCTGLADTAEPPPPALPPIDCCEIPAGACCENGDFTVFNVSFDDVSNALPCTACSYGYAMGGSGTLGSYTLRRYDPLHCIWEWFGEGPSLLIDPDNSDCSAGVEYSLMHVYMQYIFPGRWVIVAASYWPGFEDSLLWFQGETGLVPSTCCDEKDMDASNLVSPDCSGIGYGGTATVTAVGC